ncbi:hypothetical protein SK128_012923 [Halocaridina rubra]|uniref:Cadherin domain-containing protein n=1 Tax=Halocaridina rubra TaxID=373956 RepID=A0AAN8XGJ6_HALRR
MAVIKVKNTPEAPVFDSSQYLFAVTEFAKLGSYVGTVVARDADGDFSHYELSENKFNFVINRNNGIISVLSNNFGDVWEFNFFAVAIDKKNQQSQVPVRVSIIDENTNKPVFPACSDYQSGVTVSENQTAGVNVLLVEATDADHGENGEVTYSLLNDFNSFEIRTINGNGEIKTTRTLDRDGADKDFFLTVIAKDSAPKDSLQEACSFQITVTDINDNPPIFDQPSYDQNIATDHSLGSAVLRVTATDMDSGPNADLEYSLEPVTGRNEDITYFSISKANGIISLNKSLSDSMTNTKTFYLTARATDKGNQPQTSTVRVTVNVVSSGNLPPSIISENPSMEKLPEDAKVGTVVYTVCARSNIADKPNVYFTLVNGNTQDTNEDGTFALERLINNDPKCPGARGAEIYLAVRNLDYEAITVYKLILQVANDANARADEQLIINIEDVNDNPPVPQPFEGSVVENSDMTLITTIMAVDKDVSPEFRNLKYYFDTDVSQNVLDNFDLREQGQLWTKGELDREVEKQYRIPVRVTDGAYNRSYTYWITVQDVNDVAPIFDHDASTSEVILSESREVDKDTGINLVIIDPDVVNHNDFHIISGNDDQKFRIDSTTGDVLVNKPLDYDEPVRDRNFSMIVRLSDGANDQLDIPIIIAIKNENDNQPVFDKPNYTFQVTENTDCDFHFGDVSATDPDLPPNEDQNIYYYLFAPDSENFTIGSRDGKLKTLGVSNLHFKVLPHKGVLVENLQPDP